MGLGQGAGGDRGYAMAALLIGLSIMAVLMTAALPVWSHFAKREREEELIWRGNQYARAIGLFQRKYANTFPPTIDILVQQKFLRKKYKDPVTNDDFLLIPAGGAAGGIAPPPGRGVQAPGRGQQAVSPGLAVQPAQPGGVQQPPPGQLGGFQPAIGIQGVTSKSKDASIKIYNGRTRYNEWAFVYLATAQRIGQPQPGQQQGVPFPGGRGGPQGGERRPGVGGAFDGRGGAPGQPPFGQSPFGQPGRGGSPFGQPQPGQQPFGPMQPGQQPFGRPPVAPPPSRPPG